MSRVLIDLQRASRWSRVGGKAASLAELHRRGFAVPSAWFVPAHAVRDLTADPARYASMIAADLDGSPSYAVRSSADVEDQNRHSFAGRFQTLLDVPAADVPDAIVSVGASGSSEPVDAYVEAAEAADPCDTIGVVVQRMVRPHAAGVAFSRNPVTGIKETVIEAVAGSAEDLLAGRRRPERWVRKRGEWLLVPDQPVVPDGIAEQIADGVERLDRTLGYSVDAEWAWDGKLWWLQARPVTAGNEAAVYSSRLARDMLPGIVLPLVWSINGPLNSEAFCRFLGNVFGDLDVRPSDLSALFHYRMYINIGALSRLFAEFGLPEESLELLAGMERGAGMPGMPRPTPRAISRVPHLLSSVRRFSRFDRELEVVLPGLWEQAQVFAAEADPDTLDERELLARIGRLREIVGESAYYHLVTLMVMQMFTMRLRAALVRAGFIEKGETLQLPGGEIQEDDVGTAVQRLADVAADQPAGVRAMVKALDLDGLRASPEAAPLMRAVDDFLRDYGHLSDSGVNFSAIPWCEQPECVLAMMTAQMDAAPSRSMTRGEFEREHELNRSQRRAYRRALTFQSCRDRTSALYTYGYGQFRPHVLALGRRLVVRGALDSPEEIFYLSIEEIERVAEGSLGPSGARSMVAQRTEEVAIAAEGEPPEVVVGDVAELVRMPTRRVLRGTPSSRGRYTGRVVVCRGIADLSHIVVGDVVVVPFSDASWTPLFTRAGAIVAESGGVLSHSAILARELGLPAVVSVRGALHLADGSLVSVDGFEGTVTVVDAAS